MGAQANAAEDDDARRVRRANVFLAAALHAGGACMPVRIRNLSPIGALVDGKGLPEAGTAVRVQRGPHCAAATVVWSSPAACGLKFETPVRAPEWIAYGRGHPGQQRVDEMIAIVRAGGDPAAAVEPPRPLAAVGRMQTVDQLESLSRELGRIALELAAAPAGQAAAALRKLDIATQRLVGLTTMACGESR